MRLSERVASRENKAVSQVPNTILLLARLQTKSQSHSLRDVCLACDPFILSWYDLDCFGRKRLFHFRTRNVWRRVALTFDTQGRLSLRQLVC